MKYYPLNKIFSKWNFFLTKYKKSILITSFLIFCIPNMLKHKNYSEKKYETKKYRWDISLAFFFLLESLWGLKSFILCSQEAYSDSPHQQSIVNEALGYWLFFKPSFRNKTLISVLLIHFQFHTRLNAWLNNVNFLLVLLLIYLRVILATDVFKKLVNNRLRVRALDLSMFRQFSDLRTFI